MTQETRLQEFTRSKCQQLLSDFTLKTIKRVKWTFLPRHYKHNKQSFRYMECRNKLIYNSHLIINITSYHYWISQEV